MDVLRKNSQSIENIRSYLGDATNLDMAEDNAYDMTLALGPFYHLYDKNEVNKAIDEAIRVTKKNGIIMVAFLSVYAILYSEYLNEGLKAGLEENFTEDHKTKHFKEQLFTGYDVVEFENLFSEKSIEHIVTTSVDSVLELVSRRDDFVMSDEDFNRFAKYHLATCETRENLGTSNHLLYICRKK